MSIGYPDDQGYPNSTGPPIADQPAFSLSPGTPFHAEGFVGNFPAVRVHVSPAGGTNGCAVNVSYYDDETKAFIVGQYNWIIGPGSALPAVAPNLAPYVTIDVTTTVAGANNCAIQLTPMTTAVPSVRYYAVGNEGTALNVAIPASGNTTLLLPFVVEGPGQLFVNPRDTAGKLNFEVWEIGQSGGNQWPIALIQNPAGPAQVPLYAAGQTLRLAVNNVDAAGPHSFDARLVVDGR